MWKRFINNCKAITVSCYSCFEYIYKLVTSIITNITITLEVPNFKSPMNMSIIEISISDKSTIILQKY